MVMVYVNSSVLTNVESGLVIHSHCFLAAEICII